LELLKKKRYQKRLSMNLKSRKVKPQRQKKIEPRFSGVFVGKKDLGMPSDAHLSREEGTMWDAFLFLMVPSIYPSRRQSPLGYSEDLLSSPVETMENKVAKTRCLNLVACRLSEGGSLSKRWEMSSAALSIYVSSLT